eukprot:TRINITY_DN49178_c0_g1_i1.p1 TRINITY_DN49178_c0_g1~~TRINITY_DN49178_c0_g1_i1.p1  ORF type:complete len:1504 (+),score=761.23 TRINITY_DN49178_c0_g1_i1:103-4512(+)
MRRLAAASPGRRQQRFAVAIAVCVAVVAVVSSTDVVRAQPIESVRVYADVSAASANSGASEAMTFGESEVVAVSRDGLHVYQLDTNTPAITVWRRASRNGDLSFVQRVTRTDAGVDAYGLSHFDGARDILVTPNDTSVAVASNDGVVSWRRNTTTGWLSTPSFAPSKKIGSFLTNATVPVNGSSQWMDVNQNGIVDEGDKFSVFPRLKSVKVEVKNSSVVTTQKFFKLGEEHGFINPYPTTTSVWQLYPNGRVLTSTDVVLEVHSNGTNCVFQLLYGATDKHPIVDPTNAATINGAMNEPEYLLAILAAMHNRTVANHSCATVTTLDVDFIAHVHFYADRVQSPLELKELTRPRDARFHSVNTEGFMKFVNQYQVAIVGNRTIVQTNTTVCTLNGLTIRFTNDSNNNTCLQVVNGTTFSEPYRWYVSRIDTAETNELFFINILTPSGALFRSNGVLNLGLVTPANDKFPGTATTAANVERVVKELGLILETEMKASDRSRYEPVRSIAVGNYGSYLYGIGGDAPFLSANAAEATSGSGFVRVWKDVSGTSYPTWQMSQDIRGVGPHLNASFVDVRSVAVTRDDTWLFASTVGRLDGKIQVHAFSRSGTTFAWKSTSYIGSKATMLYNFVGHLALAHNDAKLLVASSVEQRRAISFLDVLDAKWSVVGDAFLLTRPRMVHVWSFDIVSTAPHLTNGATVRTIEGSQPQRFTSAVDNSGNGFIALVAQQGTPYPASSAEFSQRVVLFRASTNALTTGSDIVAVNSAADLRIAVGVHWTFAYTFTRPNEIDFFRYANRDSIHAVAEPTKLVYANNPAVLRRNESVVVASYTPTWVLPELEEVSHFDVQPALPSGLTLSATTGAISGTPNQTSGSLSRPQVHTVTLYTRRGSTASTSLQLVVLDIAPFEFAYNTSTHLLTVGTNVSIAAPLTSGTGANATEWSIVPSLPGGLKLNSDGSITGEPTTVTPVAVYAVTARTTGGSRESTIVLSVLPAPVADQIGPNGTTIVAPVQGVLEYPANPIVFVKGAANTTVYRPSISGVQVVRYAIQPRLPTGLLFNTQDGAISGSATVVSKQRVYTVSATTATGAVTTPLLLQVNDELVGPFSYATKKLTLDITRPIVINAPELPTTGGSIERFTIAPPLPIGVVFDSATGAISGQSTTASAMVGYSVCAENSGGCRYTTLFLEFHDPQAATLGTAGIVTEAKDEASEARTYSIVSLVTVFAVPLVFIALFMIFWSRRRRNLNAGLNAAAIHKLSSQVSRISKQSLTRGGGGGKRSRKRGRAKRSSSRYRDDDSSEGDDIEMGGFNVGARRIDEEPSPLDGSNVATATSPASQPRPIKGALTPEELAMLNAARGGVTEGRMAMEARKKQTDGRTPRAVGHKRDDESSMAISESSTRRRRNGGGRRSSGKQTMSDVFRELGIDSKWKRKFKKEKLKLADLQYLNPQEINNIITDSAQAAKLIEWTIANKA